MEDSVSFGYWLRRRRKALDLTQEELAQRVGCSMGLIRKLEYDERRPSKHMAERLADQLKLVPEERAAFLKAARGTLTVDWLTSPIPASIASPAALGIDEHTYRKLKGYELQEPIGAGSFGAVYRAYQREIGRTVAVKIILPQYANHPDFIRRFETEAQLIARLEHPHIIPLYDYWREPGGAYLVMRLVQGGNLATALRARPWPIDTSIRLLEQLAAALMHAHRHHVVHRDLKPTNILLDEEGNAYLADFGIAKHLDSSISSSHPSTNATALVGVLAYRSPEQIQNDEPVTPQTDIYSLGVLLYELLTGANPFADLAPTDLLARDLSEPLPPLQQRRPDLPAAVNRVIQIATAKHPKDRYPDAMSFVADLLRAVATENTPLPILLPDMARPVGGILVGADAAPGTADITRAGAHGSAALITTMLTVENPYKGLRAFAEADAADFFGRAALTQQLCERLRDETALARFLVVVGPSGSGKSSVVRAGLVPALRQGALPGSEHWFIISMLPGTHPLEELEAALLRVAINPPSSLLAQLQEDTRGFLRAVKRVLPEAAGTKLVLIIDQFEEVFTLVAGEADRLHLLNSLHAAATDPGGRVHIIITLRADFYDRPLLYPNFGDMVRQRTEVVLPLTPGELHQAIICPAERAGVTLEADLVATIMNDVGAQPGALPLLQYALTELFERRTGRRITLDAYNASGGVAGALARRAEALYAELDADQQAATQQLFLRLVTPGEGTEDTRRRVPQTELASLVNNEHTLDAVIDAYGKYRLLTFDRDPITRGPTVEVAHEALIRSWRRLRDWLEAGREDLRLQQRLTTAAAEWATARRDPSFLATGVRLEQFAGWAAKTSMALNQDEQTYLDASITERDRQAVAERESQAHKARMARRARNVLGALVVVLLLSTMGALALASVATRNASEAQNLALATGAQAALSKGNTDLALALALTANRMDHPMIQAQLTLAEAAYAPGTRRSFQGHSATVNAVAFSPDGRTALSASEDQTLIVWDIATGQLIRRFVGHTDKVTSVAFSPDGLSAISSSLDTTLILWDIASGQPIRHFPGHSAGVNAVAFSPHDHTALSGSGDKTLILWDIASGKPIQHFQGHSAAVNAVAFSPDGQIAISGSEDASFILWHLATAEVRRQVKQTEAILSVAFSPNGQTVVSGSRDSKLRMWDAATGDLIQVFAGHGSGAKAVTFSPDGQNVLSGSADTTLRLWDLANGAQIRSFIGHAGIVRSVAFSPDGLTALSSSLDKTLILWDIATGKIIRRFRGHTDEVNSLAFSPNGRMALSTSGDQTLILWDIATGQPIRHFRGHSAGVTAVAFSPDGLTALSGSLDKTMILWDIATGQIIRRLEGHTDNVYRLDFSPDGRMALSASGDRTLILWDIATGQIIRRLQGHTAAVRDVAFSSNGQTALSGSDDATLILWNVASGKPIRQFDEHSAKVYGVALSPDGQTALSGSADLSVILWDVATGQSIRRFQGHTATVRDVAFSPNGRSFISSSLDASVRLWRIDSLDELIAWTVANRYIPDLNCDQRKRYRLEPACHAGALDGS